MKVELKKFGMSTILNCILMGHLKNTILIINLPRKLFFLYSVVIVEYRVETKMLRNERVRV